MKRIRTILAALFCLALLLSVCGAAFSENYSYTIRIYAGNQGYLDDLPVESIPRFRSEMLDYVRINHSATVARLRAEGKFNDEIEKELNEAIEAFKLQFIA